MPAAASSSDILIHPSVFSHKPPLKIWWSSNPPCLLDEFQNFIRRLPTFYALNMSAIQYFWKMEPAVLQRYKQLELSTQQLMSKAQRIVHKIFTLSKRCQNQPKIILLRERWGADAYYRWPFSGMCLVVYKKREIFAARRNITSSFKQALNSSTHLISERTPCAAFCYPSN